MNATPATAGRAVTSREARELRRALGHFATGVTVVTCRRGSLLHGATVNSFTSVSLDPPLALVALGRRTRAAALLDAGPYVVNLLGEDQRDLAVHFAGGPSAGAVPWVRPDGDRPRLGGTLGHLVCRPWRTYDGGDHTLHVGRVEEFAAGGGRPLLFYRGVFPRLMTEEDERAGPGPDGSTAVWSFCLDGPGPVREQFVTDHETRK
ncbi:FMN reductase (NADH) RutF [Streptomyces sp. RB17]|uniref:flavin reductase family protein n=1 Tax=Streptomyces sp. RB17 TaxID=2585197 RepID=UPI001295A662|nr:flavin reductase family protein [Streptomyces sp. RB17]MQY33688.1 FMN reductase (NADH) RutF [Streptomyces sp. RB17]